MPALVESMVKPLFYRKLRAKKPQLYDGRNKKILYICYSRAAVSIPYTARPADPVLIAGLLDAILKTAIHMSAGKRKTDRERTG
jgi:hypothetical protein